MPLPHPPAIAAAAVTVTVAHLVAVTATEMARVTATERSITLIRRKARKIYIDRKNKS